MDASGVDYTYIIDKLRQQVAELQAKLKQAEESQSRLQAENERITREGHETKRKNQIKTQKSHDADCISEVHASIFGFW